MVMYFIPRILIITSKKHLLQEVVDLGHPEQLNELDLLDHLPGDAL